MIVDLNIGGVFIPGLVVLAVIALGLSVGVIRLFSAVGIHRLFAYPPLIELATFVMIYGLLVRYAPSMGLLP